MVPPKKVAAAKANKKTFINKKAPKSKVVSKQTKGKVGAGKKPAPKPAKMASKPEEDDDEINNLSEDEIDSDDVESDLSDVNESITSSNNKLTIEEDNEGSIDEEGDEDDMDGDLEDDEESGSDDDDEEEEEQQQTSEDKAGGQKRKISQTVTSNDKPKKAKIDSTQGGESSRVFIRKLQEDATEESIKQFFENNDLTPTEVILPKSKFGSGHKGYAFAVFEDAEQAKKAIACSGEDGLEIAFAKPRGESGSEGSFNRGGKSQESSILFVKNLPYDTDEDTLLNHFEGAKSVRIPKEDTGRTKGFAFIEFETVDAAKELFEQKKNSELGGRSLYIDFAAPAGEGSSGRRFGSGGRGRFPRGGSGGFNRGGYNNHRGGGGHGGFFDKRGGNDRRGGGFRGGRGGFNQRDRGSAPRGMKTTFE